MPEKVLTTFGRIFMSLQHVCRSASDQKNLERFLIHPGRIEYLPDVTKPTVRPKPNTTIFSIKLELLIFILELLEYDKTAAYPLKLPSDRLDTYTTAER